jgi:NAD(P)-dependent dehydrogenase (short-subunit alcohol dehydrogenase family)
MRNVLVTGGGKRIGRAIAERLAADHWNVIVHYNGSHQDALSTVEAIEAYGGKAVALKADLLNEVEVVRLGVEAAAAFGGLSAIVNNASVFVRDDVETGTKELWDLHMAVHVRAPFVLAQGLLNQLSDGMNGAIINIVDQRVLNPSKHFTSYTLSKMALWDQTQVLARAMAPRVRVNAIGPGPVLPSTRQSQ